MRDTFVHTLMELAAIDRNIILVTGDLGFGVLKPFWEAYPSQFINAGIAEQNMTGVATGMALEGKTVFTYSISNFPTLRCLEQIRNDAAYHKANVKVVTVGGGLCYGALGMSHHATEDIAILRALPNVLVFTPGDPKETQAVVREMALQNSTCYLRLGRGGEPVIHRKPIVDYSLGQSFDLHPGRVAYLFSTGGILGEAHSAIEKLRVTGIEVGLVSFPTVKPIDIRRIRECAKLVPLIFTVEEHNIVGGLGSAVAEILAEMPSIHARLVRIGIDDVYSNIVGTQAYLREYHKISSDAIVDTIRGSLVCE